MDHVRSCFVALGEKVAWPEEQGPNIPNGVSEDQDRALVFNSSSPNKRTKALMDQVRSCFVALGEKVAWPEEQGPNIRNGVSEDQDRALVLNSSSPNKRTKLETKDVDFSQEVEEEEEISDEENINGISDYDRMVLQRRKEGLEFLRTLGIDVEEKKVREIAGMLDPKRKTKPASKLKLKKVYQTPTRRSSRLQNKPPAPVTPQIYGISATPEHKEWVAKPAGPLRFEDASLRGDEIPTTSLVEDFKLLHSEKLENLSRTFSWYKESFSSMQLNSRIGKLVPDRIISLSVHPSTKLFVAAGDKKGRIGLWDVEADRQDARYLYEPHSNYVSCLEFNPENQVQLYSTGYDGSFRCGDMETAVFDEVYRCSDDEDDLLQSFAFLSASSLLLSHRLGKVAIIDRRTESPPAKQFVETDHRALKVLSLHPNKRNFITCGTEGTIQLWDFRAVKKVKPITKITLPRSVSSAYFSPVTGNNILATCTDNTLRVYDSSTLSGDMQLKSSVAHNNQTGRWLTPFRAVWLPLVEEGFIVGSMQQPRRIQVYNVKCKLAYTFMGEGLESVCSINAFHPHKPALIGGNSSGRVFVFM